jgi:hypothetical protein
MATTSGGPKRQSPGPDRIAVLVVDSPDQPQPPGRAAARALAPPAVVTVPM